MAIHVFFDNSNVIWGARYCCHDLEPHAYEYAVRVYYKNLFSVIEEGRDVVTKILAGSVPPSCDALWAYAQSYGYKTDLLKKVDKDNGVRGEQAVDEILHMKIANAILDYPSTDTLVIVTGDGSISTWDTGFVTQIDRALRAGWSVEVWAWDQVCSDTYRKYHEDPSKNFKLKYLNDHYYKVTFLKAGNYYRILPDGAREDIIVHDRPVKPLTS